MQVRRSGKGVHLVFAGGLFFIQVVLLALTVINVQAIPPSAAAEGQHFAELVHQGELVQAGAVKTQIEQKLFGTIKEKVVAQMEETIRAKAAEEISLYLQKNADYIVVKNTLEGLSQLGAAETAKTLGTQLDQVEAERILERQAELERQGALKAAERVVYSGPVQHIFFHPLIAYPERAFDGDLEEKGYNDWFVTVPEFRKILESLYQKDFVLIDIHALYEVKTENGKNVLIPKPLKLPKGKKPLILSIDDLNYYQYMLRNGNVFKLILDDMGNIATYSLNLKGQPVVSHDNEIIPIMDQFVREHPDFSLDGAKGVIALTGYEGVLGYRTNELASPSYAEERRQALAVIKGLKESGWSFASHGYGHLNARSISLASLQSDTRRWLEEVEPLIGPTDVYIYPFGASVLPGDPKFQFLLNSGFTVLCSVGPNPYMKFGSDYLMMDRRHMDGIALHYQATSVKDLFDAREVIDSVRPPFRP